MNAAKKNEEVYLAIEFVRDFRAPRFTMKAQERWMIKERRLNSDGSLDLAGACAPSDWFKIVCKGNHKEARRAADGYSR